MYEAKGAGWGAGCENPGEKGVESLLEVVKERAGCGIFNRAGSGRKKANQKQKEFSVSFRFFTRASGGGLVIAIFFLPYSLCSSFLPQTPGFCSAKQIFVPNFRYTTWARILNDRNIVCTLRGGRTTAGANAPEAFLVSHEKR